MGAVGFFGSRSLRPDVSAVVQRFLDAGYAIYTGCAVGGDESVVRYCVNAGAADALRLFAIFNELGEGAWMWSNVSGVLDAAAGGARVMWLAGGPLDLRPGVRCRMRSRRMVDGVWYAGADRHVGVCGWISSPDPVESPGSWGTCRYAASMQLAVVVFPVGWDISLAPALGAGRWVSAGGGAFAGAWRWQAAT